MKKTDKKTGKIRINSRNLINEVPRAEKKAKVFVRSIANKIGPGIGKIKKPPVSSKTGCLSSVRDEGQMYKAEEAKYYPRPSAYMPQRQWAREELPSGYGDNKIVILARDPHWVFAYWEITADKKMDIECQAGARWDVLKKVLRVYEISGVEFNGSNANGHFDIIVTPESNSWYIHVGKPDKSWCVDLGVITPDGRFILIARSNIVATPRDSASEVIDEEWMSIEEEFLKLYGLWGGFPGASPGKRAQIIKMMKERIGKELSSGAVSSLSRPSRSRGFWMVVNTELILYGATQPDATVTVQGMPVKLNKDGTFSLRFALPDGEQVIPVKGVSSDKEEERTITPVVKKHTV